MTQSIGSVSTKLLAARKATGMSTRAVAQILGAKIPITHATIANYEKGSTTPPLNVLAALADVYARPITWFLQSGPSLSGIQYRALHSKLRVSDKHIFEGQCLRWLEAYHRLDQHLGSSLKPVIDRNVVSRGQGPVGIANWIRDHFRLGNGPVPSVVSILETFGIRVIEVPTDLAISAMAARFGDEFIVALNPRYPSDRCRMNAAHELGHILLGDCHADHISDERQKVEKPAYEFASRLLLPKTQLEEACQPRSMVRLVQTKESFGISLAAIIYRAEEDKIWPPHICKMLWVEFAKRGWRTNEPGYVRPDRANRFESNLDAAIIDNRLTWTNAASITGLREEELRERVKVALGIDGQDEVQEGGLQEENSTPTLRLVK